MNGGSIGNAPIRQRMALNAFFPQNLNHTLSALLAARAALGYAPPAANVLLLGTSTPVSGCSRFDEPITLSRYIQANYEHRRHVDSPMWLSYTRMNVRHAARAHATRLRRRLRLPASARPLPCSSPVAPL